MAGVIIFEENSISKNLLISEDEPLITIDRYYTSCFVFYFRPRLQQINKKNAQILYKVVESGLHGCETLLFCKLRFLCNRITLLPKIDCSSWYKSKLCPFLTGN